MDISELKKVCNKRNCVERITLNYLEAEEDLKSIVETFLEENSISINKLNDNFNNIYSYALYAQILNKYIRRNNVTYKNMKEILNMIDKSKDTIRLYSNNQLTEIDFIKNLNEFIEWVGISNEFNKNICKIFA